MGARQTGQTDRVRRTTGSVFIVGMLMAALAGVAAGPTDEIRDHIQLVCLHFGDRLLRAQPGGKIAGDAALIGKNDEGRLLDRTAEDGFAVLLDDTQRERLIVETVTRDVTDERALAAFGRYIINLKPLCRGKILGDDRLLREHDGNFHSVSS